MQPGQKFDFSDADIPSEEIKASLSVTTGNTGRQMFLSKTSTL